MKVGYGLITCQLYPGDPRSYTDLYREAIELARAAERAGLDSVWISEHHFWDDGYMASLPVTAAALAAATDRITIGTGVLLAPLYDPLRLAEDAATVDLISQGRLLLGLGAGWRVEEFDRLGVPMDAVGRRVSETVRILRAAWGPSTFTHEGQIFRYGPTNVTPKPGRQIPIILGGFADDALRRAGRIADGFIGSSTRGDDYAERLSLVREGIRKSGRSESDFIFAGHFPVFATDDPERDEGRAVELLHYLRWKYQDMGTEFGRATDGPLPAAPPLDDARRAAMREALILGTPDQVAARAAQYRQAAGDDMHFIARSYFPGQPFDEQLAMIELLGEVKTKLA